MPTFWRRGQAAPRELEDEWGLDEDGRVAGLGQIAAGIDADLEFEDYRERELARRRACKTPRELLDVDHDFRGIFEGRHLHSADLLEDMLEELPFDLADCIAHRVESESVVGRPVDAPPRRCPENVTLKRELVPVPRHDHLLYLRVPEAVLEYGMGTWSYINGPRFHGFLLGSDGNYLSEREWGKLYEKQGELIARYEARLRERSGFKNGSITKLAGDMIGVEPGVRRFCDLTNDDIAQGIYYYGFPRDDGSWTAWYMTPAFYRDLVHPHVKDNKESDPFEWALNRTEVAAGFVQAIGLGHDCPVRFTEHTYRKMAPMACNQTPAKLKEVRGFHLDKKKKPLFEAAESAWGKAFSPEMAVFVLDNAGYLDVAMICDVDVVGLVKKIPQCLNNGLIIYRLIEFFRFNAERGFGAREALGFTLEVITDIYSGDGEPWWFKEDLDLRQIFDGNTDEVSGDLDGYCRLVKKLAKTAGFAFCYALQVYRKIGIKLAQADGIGEDEAINFCIRITCGFGIGNIERACNVIELAADMVNSAPTDGQKAALELFEEHAKRHIPVTEIIGRMEGQETGVELPGMISLLRAGLGLRRLKREKLDSLTIGAGHIGELTAHLARPLLERAKGPPVLRVEVGHHRLLAANLEKRLALPVAAERRGDQAVATPLLATFEFYRQLREECGEDCEDIPEIYFSFFASKMPNPFKPLRGFLKFLQKYRMISIPNYEAEFFFQPGDTEGRAEARRRNVDQTVNKYLIISNLLDAWVIGIFSDADLFGILNWMTEEVPAGLKADVERAVRTKYAARAVAAERDHDEDYKPDPARDEYFMQCDTRCGIADREMYVWIRRLKAVVEGIDVLVTMNAFMALGVLQRKDIDEIFADRLALFQTTSVGYDDVAVKDGGDGDFYDNEKVVFTSAFFLDKDGISRYAKHLRTMGRLGILDTDRLAQELRADTGAAVGICLKNLLSAVTNFEASVAKITEVDDRIKQVGLVEDLSGLIVELHEIWKTIPPFINPDTVNILLSAFMRASKYVYFSAAIAGNTARIRRQTCDGDGTGPLAADPVAETVKNVGVASLSLVSIALALGDMDTRKLAGIARARLPRSRGEGTNGDSSFSTALAIAPHEIVKEVSERLERVYDTAKQWVIEVRRDTMGLLPVGGKIHVLHPVDQKRFDAFVRLLGFSQTPFQLIHANTSVNLPAVASAAELRAIVRALEAFGIIDREFPELQIGIPGRLDLGRAAILGSAILLATEDGVEFDENSFKTNQDESVGKRIMLYDAHGPRVELPFMSSLRGRTDMQGRNSSGKDIELYQLLGTVLIQSQVGSGPFSKLAAEFERYYRVILARYGIEWVLNRTWILDPNDPSLRSDEAAMEHLQTVKGCTDLYFACAEKCKRTGVNEGVIFEVRALFDWLRREVGKIRDEVYNSSEPCREMRILLEF